MDRPIKEMHRVPKVHCSAVIVIGKESTVCGVSIDSTNIIEQMAT
jgi:hypothetical protein